jgi:hypothetical protein
VDRYVRSYKRLHNTLSFPRFPGDGKAVAGKTGKRRLSGGVSCSKKLKQPLGKPGKPGKPVALNRDVT